MRHMVFGAILGGVVSVPIALIFITSNPVVALMGGVTGAVFSFGVMMARRFRQMQ